MENITTRHDDYDENDIERSQSVTAIENDIDSVEEVVWRLSEESATIERGATSVERASSTEKINQPVRTSDEIEVSTNNDVGDKKESIGLLKVAHTTGVTFLTRRRVGEEDRSIVACAGTETLPQKMRASDVPTEGGNGREVNGTGQRTVRKTENSEGESLDALDLSILDTSAEGQVVPTEADTEMEIVVTRAHSAEDRQQQKEELSSERQDPIINEVKMDDTPDPREAPQTYGGMTYGSSLSFDGVPPQEFRTIASIPWFTRTAVEEDAENYFGQLELYSWDGQFYRGFEDEALSSRVSQTLIDVNDDDISYYDWGGSIKKKRARHVAEVAKGMLALREDH